jgi:hypothetical protein
VYRPWEMTFMPYLSSFKPSPLTRCLTSMWALLVIIYLSLAPISFVHR